MNKYITTGAVVAIAVAIVVGVAVGGDDGRQASSTPATSTAGQVENAAVVQAAAVRDGNAYVTIDREEQLLAEEVPFEGGNFETTKVYRDVVISPSERFVAFQATGFERTFVQVYDAETGTFYENEEDGDIVSWQESGKLRIESCLPTGEQCSIKESVSTERPWEFETISEPEREETQTYRDNFDAETDFITNINNADNLSRFGTLLSEVGPAAIKGTGPFTVFAPTNEAMDSFSEDATREEKIEFVKNHVAAPIFRYDQLTDGRELETIDLDTLTIERNTGSVTINGNALVTDADIESSNGIIHVVDGIISPVN